MPQSRRILETIALPSRHEEDSMFKPLLAVAVRRPVLPDAQIRLMADGYLRPPAYGGNLWT